MYCLDTNIVVDIFRGDKNLGNKVDNLMLSGTDFFITSITLCELYRGAYGHHNSQEKINEIDSFISNFFILDLDSESCKDFGEVYQRLKKSRKLIGEFDLIIGVVVKSRDLILVTRNSKHFENIGAKIEVW
jgi:tRNA(fMet)-specific endonuclease VapC